MSDDHLTVDPAPAAVKPAPLRRVEEWAKMKRTHPVTLAAAIRYARWECGDRFEPCMVSETAFDHAVAFAENPYSVANPSKEQP